MFRGVSHIKRKIELLVQGLSSVPGILAGSRFFSQFLQFLTEVSLGLVRYDFFENRVSRYTHAQFGLSVFGVNYEKTEEHQQQSQQHRLEEASVPLICFHCKNPIKMVGNET